MNKVLTAIEEAAFLDSAAEKVANSVSKLYPGVAKDIASGRQLGHPAHPMLTALPIGFWTSSLIVDLLGGKKGRKSADKLLLAGILAAVPTAWTGISDWSDTRGKEMRVGTVHAVGNVAGLLLFSSSYLARKKGRRAKGVRRAVLAMGAMAGSGYLGGHLAYRMGVGVDQTLFQPIPAEWTDVMPEVELLKDQPAAAEVAGVPILVYSSGGAVYAIADKCSHRGGPLHEGKVDQFNCTVTCPWHSSTFSLKSGEVLKGPATAPQPRYEARAAGGQIQVRASAS